MLLSLALTTGLRVSELVALDVGDIRNGKGVRSVVTLRPETTKGKRDGEIVVPEKVRRKLVSYLGWKTERGEAVGDDAPLFVSRGGGRAGAERGSRLSVRTAEHIFSTWQARAAEWTPEQIERGRSAEEERRRAHYESRKKQMRDPLRAMWRWFKDRLLRLKSRLR